MLLRKFFIIALLSLSVVAFTTACGSGDTEDDFEDQPSDDFSDDFGESSGAEGEDEFADDDFSDDNGEEGFEDDEFADEDGEDVEDDFEGDEDDEFADEDDEFGDEEGDEFADEDDEFGDEDDEFGDEEGDEFADEDFEDDDFGDEEGDEFAEEGGDEEFSDEDFEDFDEEGGDTGEVAVDEGGGDDDFADFDDGAAVADTGDATQPVDEGLTEEDFAIEGGAEDVALDSNDDIGEADPLQEGEGDEFAVGGYEEVNARLGLVSVKKIYTTPYEKNGRLLNSVYIGRPGDSVTAVSVKIFGRDRSADLVADNPWLGDGIKVGEKMYYNSPTRPADNTKVLTFYEDVGVQPQTYTAKAGDNIRTLSQNFLGFEGAWKEVWATNPDVSSKDSLAGGEVLSYWVGDSVPINNASASPVSDPGFEPQDINDPNSTNLASNGAGQPIDPGLGDPSNPMDPGMNSGNGAPGLNNPGADPFAANNPGGTIDPVDDIGSLQDPDVPPMDPIAQQPPAQLPPEDISQLSPPAQDPIAGNNPQNAGNQPTIGQKSITGNSTLMLLVGVIVLAAVALIAIQFKNKRRPPSMEYTQV